MFGKSAFVIALASAAFVAPALSGCTASFKAGSEPAAAPTPAPPPPPPPPPAPVATTPPPPPPPAPAPAPAAPATVVTKGDSVQIPGEIEFDTGSATFKAGGGSDAVITQLVAYLNDAANKKITKLRIEGHTDNTGTADGNLTLSGQRALTVKNAAIAKGVKKERLLAVGFGQTKPIGDNTTDAGRAKNRRTEFRIAEISGKKYLGLDETGGGKVFE
jgi:OOP family OmpA-OmpF porin